MRRKRKTTRRYRAKRGKSKYIPYSFMRNRTRVELRMLRHIAWRALKGKKCSVCTKSLLPKKRVPFGHGDAPPLKTFITIHHKNGKSKQNTCRNTCFHHRSCHKAFEMRKRYR